MQKDAVSIPNAMSLYNGLQFGLPRVHYDHDLSVFQFTPSMVIDEVIGACICGEDAGVILEIKFLVDQVEPADRGRSVVPSDLCFKDLIVALEDGVDLGDEKRLVPAVNSLSFPVACIPAVIVAVLFIPPAEKFLSAGEAFKGREMWVEWAHGCKSIR